MNKIAHKYFKILGVSVISKQPESVLRQVRQNVLQNRKFLIVTPNPEHIVQAQIDSKFAKILNKADISIPDGVGLALAAKFLSLSVPKNPLLKFLTLILQGIYTLFLFILDRSKVRDELRIIKGRQMFLYLISLANKKGWRVVLLGDKLESAQKASKRIMANYKGIKLFSLTGPGLDEDANPKGVDDQKLEADAIEQINSFKPQFLFVGFRAPVQEKWLYKWLPKLKVNGTMVVGGTFDYLSGKTKLPPRWIENMGFEWLWRLLTGSQKFGRIWNATVVFSYKVFLQKLK